MPYKPRTVIPRLTEYCFSGRWYVSCVFCEVEALCALLHILVSVSKISDLVKVTKHTYFFLIKNKDSITHTTHPIPDNNGHLYLPRIQRMPTGVLQIVRGFDQDQ